jgi:hypothetical protein
LDAQASFLAHESYLDFVQTGELTADVTTAARDLIHG